jgi:two-component system, response regulator / RNA-binding antiterminator
MAGESASHATAMRQRILVAAEHEERLRLIEGALVSADHRVVAAPAANADLALGVRRTQPDALIVEVTAPPAGVFGQWRRLLREQPLPMVVFTERGDSDSARVAVEAGISAYVVDGLKPERVLPILEAAIARFRQFKMLREQRDEAIERLTERRDIERAKGVLMRRRNLAEHAAYEALRKMAMDRGARLVDVAQSIITAEELLLKN